MQRKLIAAATIAVCAAGIALLPTNNNAQVSASAVAPGETFDLDSLHSGVFFKIRHMSVSSFMGRFNKVEGTFNIDWDNPTGSFMDITVDASSVDSNDAKRDKHLRSPDFFNTKQFPAIAFTGKEFNKTSGNTMEITGDLSFLGITRSVTATAELMGVGDTPQGYKVGLDITFKIKRTDFKNTMYLEEGYLGDEVELHAFLVGRRADG